MPFFSVIIPVYNRYRQCKQAIDSVLNQSCRDFELIVVDDGSTDRTKDLATEYKDTIRYIRQANCGVSASRNRGIINATGTYLTFLDSDDTWLPEKLEKHKYFIQENPKLQIHQTEDIWIRNNKRVNPKNIHLKKDGELFIESLALCLISPSAVAIHKKLFETYGLFDENLPACEDYDLWLRITVDKEVGLIHKPLVIRYAGHEDQLSQKYWGMDRFRVYSILKLLTVRAASMPAAYRQQARNTALKKLSIIKNGASKRGRNSYVNKLNDLIALVKDEAYSNIHYQFLADK